MTDSKLPESTLTRRARREAIGVSLDKAAVLAGVSAPTAKVFELDPDAVKDPRKRASLHRVYDSFSSREAFARLEAEWRLGP